MHDGFVKAVLDVSTFLGVTEDYVWTPHFFDVSVSECVQEYFFLKVIIVNPVVVPL